MPLFSTEGANSVLDPSNPTPSPRIVLLGTSHKTANLDFREKFAVRLDGARDFPLAAGLREHSVLQTCNRVELYGTMTPEGRANSILESLGYETAEGFYLKSDLDAISHLFNVAIGLDSVALGEGQILRQVRAAGIKARASGSAKSVLAPLFDAAYTSGVRVRSKYQSGSETKSQSEVALRFALERFDGVPSDVLVAGTGETARLAALQVKGAKIHLLTNRRGGTRLIPNSVRVTRKSLRSAIARCALVVCATRRSTYVISAKDIPDRRRRVVLDLGFPRNVDPRVKSLRSVELIDLDDVAFFAGQSKASVKPAPAQRAVEAEAVRFYAWLTATRLNPALASIYKWAERVRADETSSAIRRLHRLSEREHKVVEVMSRRIVSRLMAPHAEFVKGDSSPKAQSEKLRLLEEIFPVDAGA